MIRPLIFALPLLVAFNEAQAFDVNDCILNGMKGVSSDVAARQIRQACLEKGNEAKRKKRAAAAKEFGEAIDTATLKPLGNHFSVKEPGFHSSDYENTSTDRTLTYVQISVAPSSEGAGCDYTNARKHAYKIKLKPRETMSFLYPSSAQVDCIAVESVYARPPTWSDISVFSSSKPLDKDPFADF